MTHCSPRLVQKKFTSVAGTRTHSALSAEKQRRDFSMWTELVLAAKDAAGSFAFEVGGGPWPVGSVL